MEVLLMMNPEQIIIIQIFDIIPARLSKDLDFRRWNYRCLTSKFTASGSEKCQKKVPNNKWCFVSILGNLKYFDEREEGYDRIKIPNDKVESC